MSCSFRAGNIVKKCTVLSRSFRLLGMSELLGMSVTHRLVCYIGFACRSVGSVCGLKVHGGVSLESGQNGGVGFFEFSFISWVSRGVGTFTHHPGLQNHQHGQNNQLLVTFRSWEKFIFPRLKLWTISFRLYGAGIYIISGKWTHSAVWFLSLVYKSLFSRSRWQILELPFRSQLEWLSFFCSLNALR